MSTFRYTNSMNFCITIHMWLCHSNDCSQLAPLLKFLKGKTIGVNVLLT